MSYTLALGPFNPAWRGPQRLLLKIEGESVIDITYRAGYNERGCTERLARLPLDQALFLVSRICGPCSHAHTLAFCQALETLAGLAVPERAAYLRCAVAEAERLLSHLETLTNLFMLLELPRFTKPLQQLKAQARQTLLLLTGRPTIPDICLPGGLRHDLNAECQSRLLSLLAEIKQKLFQLGGQVIDDRILFARTVDVGILTPSAATQFRVRGPLARASGLSADLRLDQPYAAYGQLEGKRIVQEGGDVNTRLTVLLLEALESTKLVTQALEKLPAGPWKGILPPKVPAGQATGAVESPRGLLRYTVESDGEHLTAVALDAPHQLERLVARTLLVGALLDNVMLITQSTDHCVACAEG